MIIHSVKSGETMYDIAREYCISPRALASQNGLYEGARLYEGEELTVVIPTRTATVRRGENIDAISKRFGVKESELLSLNPELRGKNGVYYGQSLAIKKDPCLYGTGALNGYFYRGCPKDKLTAAMPYLCIITLSAGVAEGGSLRLLMRDNELVEYINGCGRGALLRVYIEKMPTGNETDSLSDAIAIYLGSSDYMGATLSLPKEKTSEGELAELVLKIKKKLMDIDKILLTEGESEKKNSHALYADGCILYCDKIQKKEPPSFLEYERDEVEKFVREGECTGVFLDISPFALYGEKYITEEEARAVLLKRNSGVIYDRETGISRCRYAGRKGQPLVYESISNTVNKAKLVGEYALAGLSLDIARTGQKKYTAISSTLNLCTDPGMMSFINFGIK